MQKPITSTHTFGIAIASSASIGNRVHVVVLLASLAVWSVGVVGTVHAVTSVACPQPEGFVEDALVRPTIAVACCNKKKLSTTPKCLVSTLPLIACPHFFRLYAIARVIVVVDGS